nr:MAG TPA: hypothetical protein [Bacteriophage sp.]
MMMTFRFFLFWGTILFSVGMSLGFRGRGV